MPDVLRSRLNFLRTRVRQMTWLYGLSCLVAFVFGAAFLAGFLDWWFHLEDPGVRFLIGVTIMGFAGWMGWRLLVRPLKKTLSDVEIALRIENRFPGFRDSLASTVQFTQSQNAAHLGSPAMQQKVVEQTVQQVERIRLSDMIETRRVRKAAILAMGVCVVTAGIASWNQAEAATALHRLVFPFASRPWPKKHDLQLVDESLKPLPFDAEEPLRLSRGETLELYVIDLKGQLPWEVRMEYRFEDDEAVVSEVLRKTSIPDARGEARDVFVASLPTNRPKVDFRAVGGDDFEMPWRTLVVVPPPELEELSVTLTPPSYTNQPMETLPEGVGHVRGLIGTRVQISARATKALKMARLRVKNFTPVPLMLDEDRQTLSAEFFIREAGIYSWWFDLKDSRGFENANAPRYEVRAVADAVPDVWIDRPARDENVTPGATVSFTVGAKDDLGLTMLNLQWQIPVEPPKQGTIPLFIGEEQPLQAKADYEWDLTELALQPGMEIECVGEARDAFDLSDDHIGRSIVRRLRVVSPEEKASELEFRQAGLIDELEETLKAQKRSHDELEQLRIQLATAGQLRMEDIDLLKRLEIEQRQIASRLAHPTEGLATHTNRLLKELDRNKLDQPEMRRRLEGIGREIKILNEDHLPKIEQDLTSARKMAQIKQGMTTDSAKPPKSKTDEKTALEQAGNHQQSVIDSLGDLLAQLSEWRNHRDLSGEVGDAVQNQEALINDTGEIGQRTFGKRPADLTPQERADLEKLADRQQKQAERVGNLADTLEDIKNRVEKSRPQSAGLFQDAIDHLREQAVTGNLRETAQQISNNQIGEAAQNQKDALEDLEELSNLLEDRTESDTESLIKKLEEAREELLELRKRQEELQKKLNGEKDAERLESLRQEQEEIRREMSSLARRLRRFQAPRAGGSLRRAATRMEELERLLQENPEKAAKEQQEILDDLDQAERELAAEEQQVREQLAREMLERIADELESLIALQQNVIEETNRLEALRRERGRLTRAQLKSLRDLAENQLSLKSETDRLAELITAAEVFAMALRGASREMGLAATRLSERLTDQETVTHELSAKNRFVDLVAALNPEKKDKPKENTEQKPGNQDENQNSGPQTDGIPHLAQLRMLKTLQQDLITETDRLDRHFRAKKISAEDYQRTSDRLAGEQGTLADLARNLTKQFLDTMEAKPQEPTPTEPEQPTEKPTEKTPPKKNSLEEELEKDLNLDDLLPAEDSSAKSSAPKMFRANVLVYWQPPKDETRENKPEKDGFDLELFKDLAGEDPVPRDVTKNPLDEAIKGMREAQTRIGNQQTGDETRKIQEQVVADLQKLLDMAEQQQQSPPPTPPNSPPPPPQNKQPQDNAEQKPNPQPKNPSETAGNPSQSPPQKTKDNAEESAAEERQKTLGAAKLSPRPEMLNEVWGHLPPAVRQKLLSLSSDKYLPQYEDLARRYFEALAEPETD